jgi:hypothetical protein
MLVATYAIALTPTATSSDPIVTPMVASKLETVLSNGVTIYSANNSLNVAKLTKVVNEFLKIWNDIRTFVDIQED